MCIKMAGLCLMKSHVVERVKQLQQSHIEELMRV